MGSQCRRSRVIPPLLFCVLRLYFRKPPNKEENYRDGKRSLIYNCYYISDALCRFRLSLFFFVGVRIEMKVLCLIIIPTVIPDDLVAVSRANSAHFHIDVEESKTKRFQLQIRIRMMTVG